MAFTSPLGTMVELNIGGTWTDVTPDVQLGSKRITITRGRPDESSRTDISKCRLTINNRDGKYTPKNPTGPYYGLIGRNTPMRVSVYAGDVALQIPTGATTGNISTPDAAALDITGDIDIRLDATLDNWRTTGTAGSVELAGKYASGTQRSWLLVARNGKLHLEWSADGTAHFEVESTVPLPSSRRLAVRVTLDVNNGASGSTAAFYTAATMAGPWAQLGDPVITAGTTSIFNSTSELRVGNGASFLTFAVGSGRYHAFELRNGIGGSLVANPDLSAQAEGAASFTDAAGRTWTANAPGVISRKRIRFSGEVSSWPPEWGLSGQDVYVALDASGIQRRLGQGAKALQSTLRRRIPSGSPLAYWPMEEGATATQAYSPIAGVAPLKTTGFTYGADSSLAGSAALPSISTNAILRSGVVPASPGATQWHTEFVFNIQAGPATARTVINYTATGTVRWWRLMLDSGGAQIYGYDDDGATVTSQAAALTGLGVFGAWTRWQLYAVTNGANVDWTVRWIPIGGTSGSLTNSYAGSVGRITGVVGPDSYHAELDGIRLGHIGVFATANTTIYNSADHGFNGETAGARMVRLSSEETIPVTVYGDTTAQEQMGPQRPDTFLSLASDAADVDGGILYERRDGTGLVYRDRDSLYNQGVGLALDYRGSGHIAPPFRPVGDDQMLRNDRTVTRTGGSSARATLDEGPLSIQDPPDGVGVYDDEAERNLYDDDQPAMHAAWLLHLGTWDEDRWSTINLKLHKATDLIDQAADMDIGDRATIVNPPAWIPPGTIDQLMQSQTETLGVWTWDMSLNCSPAGPWSHMLTWDDAALGRWDTDSSELASAATSTATSLSVAVTSGLLWVTSADKLTLNPDFEIDLSNWTAVGSSLARVPTPSGAPFAGSWSAQITPNGVSSTAYIESATVTVTAGTTYYPHGWLRCATSRSVNLSVNWYTAASVYVSTSSVTLTVEAGVWTEFSGSATAPGTAGKASVLPSMGSTPPASDVLLADVLLLSNSATGTAQDFPFAAELGGEQVLVRAITGSSSPQTFTTVRSTNGIVKAQSSGTAVELAFPCYFPM